MRQKLHSGACNFRRDCISRAAPIAICDFRTVKARRLYLIRNRRYRHVRTAAPPAAEFVRPTCRTLRTCKPPAAPFLLLLSPLARLPVRLRRQPDPASLVNPLVGTTNGGNVFPGATMPFGMVQFSPEATPVNTKADRRARRLRISRKADPRLQPDQRRRLGMRRRLRRCAAHAHHRSQSPSRRRKTSATPTRPTSATPMRRPSPAPIRSSSATASRSRSPPPPAWAPPPSLSLPASPPASWSAPPTPKSARPPPTRRSIAPPESSPAR